jgi:DNA-binding NtrC family response regulator
MYLRLGDSTVRGPPLRERKAVSPRVHCQFLAKLAPEGDATVPPVVLRLLMQHDFPGNVRELRNFAERYLALPGASPESLLGRTKARGDDPTTALPVSADEPFHDAKRSWTDRFERAYLEDLLRRSRGNVSEAARLAGLSRQTCYRLMEKHGLEEP